VGQTYGPAKILQGMALSAPTPNATDQEHSAEREPYDEQVG